MSILSYYAVPKLLIFNSFTESVLHKKILNSLIYAQTRAMYSGCHVAINISQNSFSLKLRSSCRDGQFLLPVKDPNNPEEDYIIMMPTDIVLDSINFPMYFDHNGQGRLVSNNHITNSALMLNGSKLQKEINIIGNNGIIQ